MSAVQIQEEDYDDEIVPLKFTTGPVNCADYERNKNVNRASYLDNWSFVMASVRWAKHAP
jgi:hypothetical protein